MINKLHKIVINVFTDGSLKRTSNGTYCGYGIYFPNKELKNVAAPFTIGEITNNRAELHAILQTIIRIKKVFTFDKINIYTDSEYAKKSLTEYIHDWKNNNWKNSKKQPVKNQDIIRKIDKYLERYNGKINIQWIRAHTNDDDYFSKGNEKADKLANKGADKSKPV
jgi:ribonuclease HI